MYISGHPLEEYADVWKKNITAATSDFYPMEESGLPKVRDGAKVIVGGMITEKTIKYTKNNKVMAFITLEDLVGTVEVVVFPRDYEKIGKMLNVDDKVFVSGRISAEEDRASKMILESIRPFSEPKKELWIQFTDVEEFKRREPELLSTIMDSEGSDSVIIYVKKEKMKKVLPASRNIKITDELLGRLYQIFGEKNVKAVEKYIENTGKMH